MIPHDLFLSSNAQSRSISAENPDGSLHNGGRATSETTLNPRKAQNARDLGPGWKVSPCIDLMAGDSFTFADITGPGIIRHIWITVRKEHLRNLRLEVFWDDATAPSICVPLGDFFCQAWGKPEAITALLVNVNSVGGMNCYIPMPFRKKARFVIHNDGPQDVNGFFYTVNYTLEDIPENACYLHCSWRREHATVPGNDLVIADGIEGRGHFLGCFLAWQQNSNGWWGEGEVKMFIDDDKEFPTICGTGTEDYFGGAWGFQGGSYSAPWLGFSSIIGENRTIGARMTMYRFHGPDPIYFQKSFRATCQALGWRSEGRYLQLRDDISATAWWYQEGCAQSGVPALPSIDDREEC